MIESVLGVWHWTLPDRSRPLGGEAGYTFGQHGVLGIFDNSFDPRAEEKQGLCVPFWNGAEGGGQVPLTLVALGSCLPSGRAGGWKHLVSRARALAADLWAHKARPSATGKGPRLPCVCQQRLQAAMMVNRAQHKQPPEKGAFVVSGGQLLDCQGLPAQCGWGRSWQVLPTHSLLWSCRRLCVLLAELGMGSRACGSLSSSFIPSFLSSSPLIFGLFVCTVFSLRGFPKPFPCWSFTGAYHRTGERAEGPITLSRLLPPLFILHEQPQTLFLTYARF